MLQTNLSAALVHAPDNSTRLQVGCLTSAPSYPADGELMHSGRPDAEKASNSWCTCEGRWWLEGKEKCLYVIVAKQHGSTCCKGRG